MPLGASQVVVVVKNPPANAGHVRDAGSIPASGRSPGGGHGNLLHYSCLENPMDREAWWATVHKVTKSQTWLKWLSTHTQNATYKSWKKETPQNKLLFLYVLMEACRWRKLERKINTKLKIAGAQQWWGNWTVRSVRTTFTMRIYLCI